MANLKMAKVCNIMCYSVANALNIMFVAEFHMESEWTLPDFLASASKRLELFPTAKRLFNSDGKFHYTE